MFKRFKKQVSFVIKDQAIRYIVSTQPTIQGATEFGEVQIEPGIIEDGKLMNPAAFQAAVKALVAKKQWKKKQLLFCVPDSSVAMREHLVPKELTNEEIKSYLQMELNSSIRLPFTDPVIDFVVLGKENNQTKILLFAYPGDRIKSYVDVFEKSGLKPIVADLTSLSLYRFYEEINKANATDHLLSVQWNMDTVILTAFHNKTPLFTRHVKTFLEAELWRWNESKLEHTWTGEQEDIDESMEQQFITLDRFIDFYQYSVRNGMDEISRILLTGDYPFLEQVENQLKTRYKLEIDTLDTVGQKYGFPVRFSELLGLSIKK